MTRGPTRTAARAGLTEAEAARRLLEVGRNELPRPRRRPLVLRLLDQLRDPMNLLLLVAAMVSGLALGEELDAVAIGAIVALNAVIALVQEGRAGHALAALEQLSTPETTVVREGVTRRIQVAELVPGDVIRVEAGDRVPADAHLEEAQLLEVDESMLTGESVPVGKSAVPSTTGEDSDRATDELWWGTFVTRGSGTAVVHATGSETQLGRLAASVDVPPPPTPLQQELGRLGSRLGVAAVAIAATVFVATLLRLGATAEGLERSFLSAVALAVAAVPEGLPTVTLVALAGGVRRMARQRAIIRRLPAVETLGSASVIVTDKTGTVTQNRMTVTAAWSLGARTCGLADLPAAVGTVARDVAVRANDATLDPPTGDPMEMALLRFAASHPPPPAPRLLTFPMDSTRKRMSAVHADPNGYQVSSKGAPEPLLACCADGLRPDGGRSPLTDEERERILHQAGSMASEGLRVLALARGLSRDLPASAAEAEQRLAFVALIGLEDPVRPGAAEAVAESRAAGIQVVMATGDHPATAQSIARSIGLDLTTEPVTGAQVEAGGLPTDPLTTKVYARMEPAQKLDLVRALQRRGEVVAMTGDGVNDAPALRSADIGVALGSRSSDLAREAADMVVTDDELATIVTAAREGRGIYDNIRKVVDYLVAGNLSEIVVVVGAMLLLPALAIPLLPLQLLWINLLTDGPPALALGSDRADPGLMRDRPRPRTSHLLDRRRLVHLTVRGALMGAACLATGYVAALRSPDPDHVRTILLTTLVVIHLLSVFVARQPAAASLHDPLAPGGWLGTPGLVAAVGAGLGLHLIVLSWSPAQVVFRTSTPDPTDWLLILAGGFAGLVAIVLHRRVAGGTAGGATVHPSDHQPDEARR